MGKSRLVHEFRQALGERVTWFKGAADRIQRRAFNPMSDFLRGYFQQSAWAPQEKNQLVFETRLANLCFNLASLKPTDAQRREERDELLEEVSRGASFLGALVGIHWPGSPYEMIDARGRHERTLAAVKSLLLAESCLKPVVLELGDANWLDEGSQGAVHILTRGMQDYPIMLVLTSRYTDDGTKPALPLAEEVRQVTLELTALGREGIGELARQILGGPLRDELWQLVYEKSQANPYFAQQLLYYFNEQRLLEVGTDGRWHLRTAPRELPASIRSILVARIDRLPAKVQQVVHAACVLGYEFEERLLIRVLSAQMPADEISRQVRLAEEKQIWREVSEGRYLFRHTLLREVAYEMQPRSLQRSLQRRAVQAKEQLAGQEI